MGNTLASPAPNHSAPTGKPSYSSHSRPSTAGLSPPPHSALRKMGSSNTLSSLARFYNHSNPSNASMASKASKMSRTSGRRKHQQHQPDKILDIGKPTHFEHGIHVEFDKDSGTFMGLPDVWQASSLPSHDILDTTEINPNLVPQPVGQRRITGASSTTSPSSIGKPYNFQHHVHIEVDIDGKGLIGLPEEWAEKWRVMLVASGVPLEVMRTNPKTVESLAHVRMPDALQDKQKRMQMNKNKTVPASPHSPHEHHNSVDPNRPAQRITQLPLGYAPPTRARSSKLLQLSSLTARSNAVMPDLDQHVEDNHNALPAAPSESHLSLDSSFIDDLAEHGDPHSLYTDLVLVAEGESGPLYAGTQIATNRLVAIKKIPRTAKEKLSKIRNELTTMKMSRHPNVVEFIACYLTPEEVWVVMECMDVSLADVIAVHVADASKEYIMQENEIARTARDVLRALCRIHRLHRIHRDIRSDNVLVNRHGLVKLSDFSHCAQLTKQNPKRSSVVGTPYWMAPEVIKGEPYDAKADIWSVGVLMLEMMQGDPPYVEYPPLRALFLIASSGLPPIQDPSKWSVDLLDFVGQCTVMDPAERADVETLIKHPFVSKNVATTKEMMALIEETRRLEMLQQENESETEQAIADDLAVANPQDN